MDDTLLQQASIAFDLPRRQARREGISMDFPAQSRKRRPDVLAGR